MNPHELKSLQVQITKLQAEEATKKEELAAAQREYQSLRDRLTSLEKKLENAQRQPTVTEHALLRYIERVYGLDMDALKAELLSPELSELILTLGTGKYPLPQGGTAVVQGLSVVSVV